MNISTLYSSPIVGVARTTSFERPDALLSFYDANAAERLSEFYVHYDTGGARLALSRDALTAFVGCYKVHGLGAYEVSDGQELWRRKDLKAVQKVSALPFDDLVFCGREGPGHLLCSKTGRTVEKCKGVRAVYTSPFSKHVLLEAHSLEIHSQFGTRIGKIAPTTFAVLDCSFSDAELVVTESGGCVRCFDLGSLELLWQHTPRQGSHFLRLIFSQKLNRFVGIAWWYQKETTPPMEIVHLDRRTGQVLREIAIGSLAAGEFCLAGSMIFTLDFSLMDVKTGAIVREFPKSKFDETDEDEPQFPNWEERMRSGTPEQQELARLLGPPS